MFLLVDHFCYYLIVIRSRTNEGEAPEILENSATGDSQVTR